TADTTKSTVAAGTSPIFADSSGGATTSTITVTLKSNASSNLAASGGNVTMATNLGTLGSVTDNGNGTYTASFSSTATGTATINASLDGRQLSASASVTVNSGAATKLIFTTQPAGAAGGSALGTQPVVKVEDTNSNVVI